ncbi:MULTISPECIES: WhiB family transcriptional regulator [Streptomyces]|uniref:WhiB family transcriptional regulator n=1 Tax=Streptomyces TaxID=1883 RepID=UPI000CF26B01|nr:MULTISPECIES: WhiB family transcriptional regulator [Streptomyces]PPS73441.1 transcriptional regulator [Streptomyces sp. 46]
MEWLRSAACVDEDPELFFPVGTAGPALRDVSAAKRVCARCPVTDPCLHFALSSGQAAGVWGGTVEEERDALLRTHRNDAKRRSAP